MGWWLCTLQSFRDLGLYSHQNPNCARYCGVRKENSGSLDSSSVLSYKRDVLSTYNFSGRISHMPIPIGMRGRKYNSITIFRNHTVFEYLVNINFYHNFIPSMLQYLISFWYCFYNCRTCIHGKSHTHKHKIKFMTEQWSMNIKLTVRKNIYRNIILNSYIINTK